MSVGKKLVPRNVRQVIHGPLIGDKVPDPLLDKILGDKDGKKSGSGTIVNGVYTEDPYQFTYQPQDEAMAQFFTSPGYAFRLGEGVSAIDRSAASRGLLNSGRTLKDLTRFGQDYGSNEYANWLNAIQALSGTGQTATNNVANLGSNFANQAGQALQSAGQARASGYINQGNIYGGALQNLGSIAGSYFGGR